MVLTTKPRRRPFVLLQEKAVALPYQHYGDLMEAYT